MAAAFEMQVLAFQAHAGMLNLKMSLLWFLHPAARCANAGTAAGLFYLQKIVQGKSADQAVSLAHGRMPQVKRSNQLTPFGGNIFHSHRMCQALTAPQALSARWFGTAPRCWRHRLWSSCQGRC